MHETVVVMKDGKRYSGYIWEYRPKQGYLRLGEMDTNLYFRDMKSCMTLETRTYIYNAGANRDEIVQAQKDGWDGT